MAIECVPPGWTHRMKTGLVRVFAFLVSFVILWGAGGSVGNTPPFILGPVCLYRRKARQAMLR